MATSTCPVARSRSCGASPRFLEKMKLPLRAFSGSTIQFAGWAPGSGLRIESSRQLGGQVQSQYFGGSSVFRLVATSPGGGKQLPSRLALGGRTVCLVCDLCSVGRLRLCRGHQTSRDPFSESSKGSSGLGRSGVGFRRFAASMLGVS